MKRAVIGTSILGFAIVGVFLATGSSGAASSSYRFVEIERGDIQAVVAATGQLSAVRTVQVGTQVSGQIEAVLVDFNDRVTRGQLIARIDDTNLRQAVLEAESNLARVKADLERREWEYERTRELFAVQGVTESEYKTAEYDLAAARTNVQSAEVTLERAQNNLAYSRIYSPIDGIVVERNVEPGQTVAASMSTPQLFLIANDLAALEILASVDESDIGRISEGQTARFTVQAYPDESFIGVVRQVRLQSAVQENVVNYTVVVSVQNEDGKLLPGMTATVDFIVQEVADVLKVQNAALRFRPSQSMQEEVRERMRAQREGRLAERDAAGGVETAGRDAEAESESPGPAARERLARGDAPVLNEEERQALRERFRAIGEAGSGATVQDAGAGFGPGGFRGDGATGSGNAGELWYVDQEGLVQVARVQVGVTDGQYTEIRGRALEAGIQVIAGVVVGTAQSGSTNPFQQQGGDRRGFGRF